MIYDTLIDELHEAILETAAPEYDAHDELGRDTYLTNVFSDATRERIRALLTEYGITKAEATQ